MEKNAQKKVENTIDFLYQETQIHFLVNPNDKNVMVNATEMAKLFDKRTDHYLKSQSTKELISKLKLTPNGGSLDEKNVIDFRGRNGIFFCEILAIDFATWLDINFKIWVYDTIRKVTLGNYKEHWDAHVWREKQIAKKEKLESEFLNGGCSPEQFVDYMETMKNIKKAEKIKKRAMTNQYKLFND